MDKTLLFAINHCSNIYMDHIMLRATEPWTWLLMGFVILLLILKDHSPSHVIALLFGLAVCILLADQLTSTLIKPTVARLRPCNDPYIMDQLRLIAGHGGGYSFPSSHAANNFAVVTFFSLVFRHRITSIMLYFWALIIGLSRIYLGMHYPSDVLAGTCIGIFVGILAYLLVSLMLKHVISTKIKFYSDAYTRTGYNINDMYLLVSAIALTFLYLVL